MTYAIFSIVANSISPSGCAAYTYAQYSSSPYLRAPYFQFSEQVTDDWASNQGTHPAFPFLTGSGGANQVVLFGYLGYRMLPDYTLHIDPSLPPQIPYVKYRTFYWHGWPLSAWSNYTHTTIRRANDTPPLDTADPRFANGPIPVHVGPASNFTKYTLPASPDQALTIRNRLIGSIATFPGNMIQCAPVTSPDAFVPGQFPISAVDGAASTKWQPLSANRTSALTVSFPGSEREEIVGFAFDWAQHPPVSARVLLHDSPLSLSPEELDADLADTHAPAGSVVALDLPSVTLSNPYDPATTDLNVIVPYKGNTTNVTLAQPVRASKFATLLVWGNQGLHEGEVVAGNGTGATVAEWVVLREDVGADSGEEGDGWGGQWRVDL